MGIRLLRVRLFAMLESNIVGVGLLGITLLGVRSLGIRLLGVRSLGIRLLGVRGHPYIMSCSGGWGVWSSATEYYENSDKNVTGGVRGS